MPESKSKTVSSLALATKTKANHFHTMRDLRKLFKRLNVDPSPYAGTYIGGNGEDRPMFNVPSDIASQYLKRHHSEEDSHDNGGNDNSSGDRVSGAGRVTRGQLIDMVRGILDCM